MKKLDLVLVLLAHLVHYFILQSMITHYYCFKQRLEIFKQINFSYLIFFQIKPGPLRWATEKEPKYNRESRSSGLYKRKIHENIYTLISTVIF